MKRLILINFLLMLLLLPGSQLPAQTTPYKLVVNRANPVDSLTKKEVSNLFLKKVSKWSNGKNVQPLDLVENSLVREKFSKDIHGRKVSSIKAYWQKQIFSGRMIPPPEKKNNTEVLAFVRNNPGAIGYVSADTNSSTQRVKVVKIVK